MDRGIYTAGSGALFSNRRIDVVSNNIANSNTVGYKAQRLRARQQEFSDTLASKLNNAPARAAQDHARTPGVVDVETVTDFTPGPIQFTGDPLHVALRNPNHFFVVSTPDGDAYTRAGNFVLDSEGTLRTPDGMQVQGEGGALTLPVGTPTITSNGSVIVNGEIAGRLRVAQIENKEGLQRTEGVRFKLAGGAQATAVPAEVVSQSVEMPNVSVITAIVEMMASQKSFEASTNTMKTIDQLNSRIVRAMRATSG